MVRRTPTGLVLALAALAGATVLAMGAYVLSRPAGGPATAAATPTASGPSGAVRGYLEALAAGDADRALAFAAEPPADRTYLTSAVLQAALPAGSLREIEVTEPPQGATVVHFRYRLRTRLVSATVDVVSSPHGYRLRKIAATVDLSGVRSDAVALRLAGASVVRDVVTLFPGTYALSSGSKLLDYGGATLTVPSPGGTVKTSGLRLKLTAQGRSTLLALARKQFEACLNVRSLTPPGCGFGIDAPAGVRFVRDTIRWRRFSGSTIDRATVTLDPTNPIVAEGRVSMRLRFDASAANGNKWFGYAQLRGFRTDLSAPDPVIVFF